MIVLTGALILFGLCTTTDRMIEARQPRGLPDRDQKSYL
jgi:hypothetical protein